MRWAVIIPTTAGPARVQQIRADTHLHHGVMTVNFRTEQASVSSDYAAFASREAGILSRLTGEHRYRTKVSRDIERGSSWKLGILIAHLLAQKDLLAQTDSPVQQSPAPQDLLANADGMIWASGDVSDTLGVLDVGQLGQKLDRSADLFAYCEEHGLPVRCALPVAAQSDTPFVERLASLEARSPVVSTEFMEIVPTSISHWLTMEDETMGARFGTPDNGGMSGSDHRRFITMGAALATFALITILLATTVLIPYGKDASEAVAFDPDLRVELSYAPKGACFTGSNADRETVEFAAGATPQQKLTLPQAARLCQIYVAGAENTVEPLSYRVDLHETSGNVIGTTDIQSAADGTGSAPLNADDGPVSRIFIYQSTDDILLLRLDVEYGEA